MMNYDRSESGAAAFFKSFLMQCVTALAAIDILGTLETRGGCVPCFSSRAVHDHVHLRDLASMQSQRIVGYISTAGESQR